jgi:asparagine synthase (glutamine-hydrolysing)
MREMKANVVDRHKPLILLHDDHVPWHASGSFERGEPTAHVRGYAASGGQVFEDESLARHLQQVAARGLDALHAEIPKLNGGWALVAAWPSGQVLAAVDRLRSVPLFFYHNQETFAIAASGTELARRFSCRLQTAGQLRFLLFGYVSGADTLYEHVRQVQPGEMIHYDPSRAERLVATRYYRFYPRERFAATQDVLSEQLANVVWRMFERIAAGLRGKRVIVPLSGGLDSRLVAGALRHLGVTDCLCYTYGDETNEEVQISRQVADALGLPWRCFRQSPGELHHLNILESFGNYRRYANKAVSTANAQDFMAVQQLAADGLCGLDTVFFPGHSADMNAGSHIPIDYPDLYSGVLSVVDEILRHHAEATWYEPLQMLKGNLRDVTLEELQRQAAYPADANWQSPLACCEMWNAEQRQSKYIINSVRAYEFVGARWRTLWDYEFMDFFLGVPDELRYGQKLYLDCLCQRIFVDDLAPLAEIPIPKYGPPRARTSLRPPALPTTKWSRIRRAVRARVRWELLKSGFASPFVQQPDPLLTTLVRLSGLETEQGSISTGKALESIGVLADLTPEIREALSPWMKSRLDNLPGFALYSVLALAHVSREAKTFGG